MVQYLSVTGEKQHQVLSSQSQHTPLHSEFGSRRGSLPESNEKLAASAVLVFVVVSGLIQKVIAVFVL